MESDTLSYTHLITKVEERNDSLLSAHSFFSFIFDIDDGKSLSELLNFVFSEANKSVFTITIRSKKSNWDYLDWMDKLCLVLCHPSYLKHNHNLFLGVQLETDFGNNFSKIVNKQLEDQGFKNVVIMDFNRSYFENINPSFLLYKDIKPDRFHEWYLASVASSHSILNIFLNAEGETVKDFFNLKFDCEKHLRNEETTIYHMIRNLQQKSLEVAECRALISLLKEDVSSKQAYLDFLLGKYKERNEGPINLNEIMKLKKYYHQEYEILPLWYKRFGHIIKVVMGKRTFRSLFNDNVEKYKR